jgi:hypothetical protein
MKFRTARGRPKLSREKKDLGTKELLAKKHAGVTEEMLDLMLNKGIITSLEHQAGLRFRWLHYLKFGTLSLRAYNVGNIVGQQPLNNDTKWKYYKEKEYEQAAFTLCQSGCFNIVADICIFNQHTKLCSAFTGKDLAAIKFTTLLNNSQEISYQIQKLREGLKLLGKLFNIA